MTRAWQPCAVSLPVPRAGPYRKQQGAPLPISMTFLVCPCNRPAGCCSPRCCWLAAAACKQHVSARESSRTRSCHGELECLRPVKAHHPTSGLIRYEHVRLDATLLLISPLLGPKAHDTPGCTALRPRPGSVSDCNTAPRYRGSFRDTWKPRWPRRVARPKDGRAAGREQSAHGHSLAQVL